ncbi:MAG TPA: helix-turn-helix domain-containing protein [Actinoallomurus sp.]|nr:helix-turn-helix domain-containing protein [Actinoallomurus sp.]
MSATRRHSSGEELLRPREVADIFGVRTSTVAQWAREGRLAPLRTPGGHRRYPRSGVENALAAHVTLRGRGRTPNRPPRSPPP